MYFFIILAMEIVAVILIHRYCDSEKQREILVVVGGGAAAIILGVSLLWAVVGQRPDFPLVPFLALAVANAAMAGYTRHRPSRHV